MPTTLFSTPSTTRVGCDSTRVLIGSAFQFNNARNTQAPFKVRITPNHPVKYKLPFRDLPDLNICIPSKLSPSLRFGLGFPRWTEPLYNYQTHHNRLTVVDKRSSNSVHVRGKRTTLNKSYGTNQ